MKCETEEKERLDEKERLGEKELRRAPRSFKIGKEIGKGRFRLVVR